LKLHLQNSELAMPVIRISQQTWERLKTYATPLEDTADDVVNVALDVEPQDVVLRQRKSADRCFITDAGMRSVPVIAV
jgi:putative N-acetylmannosamine-6-phosphate epimerase